MIKLTGTYTVEEFRDEEKNLWYHRFGPVGWFESKWTMAWHQVSEARCAELEKEYGNGVITQSRSGES